MNLDRPAYVYLLTNHSKTSLYIGVSPQLKKRITDHKNGIRSSFANRYKIDQLVYLEDFDTIKEAIMREKELKKWRRIWKDELITKLYPYWRDLSWDIIYS